jgi:hypothetical protein
MNSTLPPANQPPEAFLAEVRAAIECRQGGMLALLVAESEEFAWGQAAKRLIAPALAKLQESQPSFDHAILFTGHMIDAPARPHPRFPARAEPAAREAMLERLQQQLQTVAGRTVGIAGGASGGDLLFHEACQELGVETVLRLTLPTEQYIAASVAPAGPDWVRRFHALMERLRPSRIAVLSDSANLPAWMGDRPGYDVWQRTNLWIVQDAIILARRRTLLALWDGKTGDGPGGTQHLIAAAPGYGIDVAPPIWTASLKDNNS